MMFVLVALLLLMAAIWVGLIFATRLARPISDLVNATERVRGGDLAARVDESGHSDEIGTLNRAFNRMTEQLVAQRDGLVEANRQLDGRRHFMETVLAGVSSGVIGLDREGRIRIANRAAMSLLSTSSEAALGRRLDDLIPECRDLLEQALGTPENPVDGEVVIRRKSASQTLFVRLAPERDSGEENGYVVTFDDITELLSAQRKAAWSDVARRIAHEIKNPLTPIQLAAERLRRKYQSQISNDPETFVTCTDTIIRQVGDIGRLVDEFSSFARMPAPVMKREDIASICRNSTVLFESAHRGVTFDCAFDETPVEVSCDRRQVGQALTNLMQNALEAIEARRANGDGKGVDGRIVIEIERTDEAVAVRVSDNGIGLPLAERDRLMEPYVTTREKGTGLGLAIVQKIMEDHGGRIELDDREGGGARVCLIFPDDYAGSVEEESEDNNREKKVITHGA
jgi:two-component system nitrogen regulation sensor histidine kinase NtrY